MKLAYKDAAGMRIDGRRILVDVERGRTVKVARCVNGRTGNPCDWVAEREAEAI